MMGEAGAFRSVVGGAHVLPSISLEVESKLLLLVCPHARYSGGDVPSAATTSSSTSSLVLLYNQQPLNTVSFIIAPLLSLPTK